MLGSVSLVLNMVRWVLAFILASCHLRIYGGVTPGVHSMSLPVAPVPASWHAPEFPIAHPADALPYQPARDYSTREYEYGRPDLVSPVGATPRAQLKARRLKQAEAAARRALEELIRKDGITVVSSSPELTKSPAPAQETTTELPPAAPTRKRSRRKRGA